MTVGGMVGGKENIMRLRLGVQMVERVSCGEINQAKTRAILAEPRRL